MFKIDFQKNILIDHRAVSLLVSIISSLLYLAFLILSFISVIPINNLLHKELGLNYINLFVATILLYGLFESLFKKETKLLFKNGLNRSDYNYGILMFILSSVVLFLTTMIYIGGGGYLEFIIEYLKNNFLDLFFLWLILFIVLNRFWYIFVQDRFQRRKLIVFYLLVIFPSVYSGKFQDPFLGDLFNLLPLVFITIFDLLLNSLKAIFTKEEKVDV